MSRPYPRWSGSLELPRTAGPAFPRRDALLRASVWPGCLLLAFAVAVAMPKPSYILLFTGAAGAVAIVVLVGGSRLEVKVAMLALFLGMLDGPVKLLAGSGQEATSGLRDVLIGAVCLAPVLRLITGRARVEWPGLSGWVAAWIALVLVEAFNPNTHGILHALGGFRQLLEWVPFFFFGYALMRSKRRLRRAFLILAVIAMANAAISTYQTFLSPGQVAAWGPGYHSKIFPKEGGNRTYGGGGESHVRPLGLGADSGFSGGVGLIALPGALALLATWRGRKRWLIVVLNLGALVAIVTSLGRLQLVGAGIGVATFVAMSSIAGRRMARPVAAILGVIVLAIPVGAVFVSTLRSGTFSRYESLSTSSTTSYKASSWENIPHILSVEPFGLGLGTTGAIGGFGGKVTNQIEGKTVGAETQYNFLTDEVGAPGIVLWVGLALSVVSLAVRRLRTIEDAELRIGLAALVSPVVALLLMGFSGPLSTSAALGPYYWFAAGVAAYWFAGPARAVARRGRAAKPEGTLGSPSLNPAAGL